MQRWGIRIGTSKDRIGRMKVEEIFFFKEKKRIKDPDQSEEKRRLRSSER